MAAQQTIDRGELEQALEKMSETVASANERIGTLENGLQSMQKSFDQLSKSIEEKKKRKLEGLSGIIRQLTILVGIAGGAWIIVTILNLFRG